MYQTDAVSIPLLISLSAIFAPVQKTITDLIITDIAAEGRAMGKHEGRVVFVDRAVPGDIVNVEIKRKKNKFIEAVVKETTTFSANRAEPFCTHFGICGGCKWQNMSYQIQLTFKEKQVKDALQRLAAIESPEVLPIIASEKITEYRNRLDYAFSDREWMTQEQIKNQNYVAQPALGFHVPGKFDKVLNIKKCFLQDDFTNSIRNFVKEFALENNYSFINRYSQQGFLRNLIVRNTTTNQWMVIVMFRDDDEANRNKLLNAIADKFPEITSLQYIINTKGNDTFFDLDVHTFKGKDYLTENMDGLKFRIGPKSFYQTNPLQAYQLYKVAKEFAALTGSEDVYDLYTGTGTIANFIAANAKCVTGIETVEEAIEHAKLNSEINNITNTHFFAGDIKETLTQDFFHNHGKPDVLITDPPRAGMHPDVVKALCHSGAKKIVYVSCNPATQARDIALMKEHYTFIKAQPVDMFPHTHHVECVALLEIK